MSRAGLWLFVLIVAITGLRACGAPAAAFGESYTVSMGQLTSSDHELADGMFAVGQASAIMVKPDSAGWLRLRQLRGQHVTIIVRVDE
jgi:hypothetical protein